MNLIYKFFFSSLVFVLIIAISILIYRSEFVYFGSQRYYFFNYIINYNFLYRWYKIKLLVLNISL